MTEGPNAFTPVASVLPTGNAIMDISAGWDGTQWAVDAQGIPHVYDGVQQNWETFGRGVDAATLVGDDLYLFRDNEVAIYNTTNNQLVSTQLISEKWPQLPPMFTKDLDGAIATVRVGNIGGEIFLFHNGRYVNVNEPTAPQLANKISQWPTGFAGWHNLCSRHNGQLRCAVLAADGTRYVYCRAQANGSTITSI